MVLVPMNSGRRIIDTVRKSFEAELTFDVEPTKENVDLLAKLAGLVEPFVPQPWEPYYNQYEPNHAEILEKQAEVNAILPALGEMGVSVFAATYTALRQPPSYDMDEGHMYVTDRTPHVEQPIAVVVISDTGATHLMRQPSDVMPDKCLF